MEEDGTNNLDNTLSIVNSWMKNKLKCNLDKSKAVIFGESSQTEILDKTGSMVQHFVKYLGVLIDDDLRFKNQAEKIERKLPFHSFTHKALPEKVSITCILQNARQTNCAVWCFDVWMHSFQQPPTDFAFTEKNN